jgi:hypothetical protein
MMSHYACVWTHTHGSLLCKCAFLGLQIEIRLEGRETGTQYSVVFMRCMHVRSRGWNRLKTDSNSPGISSKDRSSSTWTLCMVIGLDNMSTFCEDEMLANGHDLGQRSKIAFYTITWYKNHIKFLSATRRPKLCRIILDIMVHIVK